jgi:hypothetical protein
MSAAGSGHCGRHLETLADSVPPAARSMERVAPVRSNNAFENGRSQSSLTASVGQHERSERHEVRICSDLDIDRDYFIDNKAVLLILPPIEECYGRAGQSPEKTVCST